MSNQSVELQKVVPPQNKHAMLLSMAVSPFQAIFFAAGFE